MDNDVKGGTASAEHQGEGGAFWRVVAPILDAADSKGAAYVTNFYTMTTAPTTSNHYCPLKALLEANLPAGLTQADMGTLEDTTEVVCKQVPVKGAEGVQEVTAVYSMPGTVSDYTDAVVADLESAFAASVGVSPTQVTVAVAAGSVVVTVKILVFEADAAAVVAAVPDTPTEIAAALSGVAGVDVSSITMTSAPVAKKVSTASSDDNTGMIIGIAAGGVVLIAIVGFVVMKKKKSGGGGKGEASAV
jgi:hypothetical protein